MSKKQIIWIVGLNIASYAIIKLIEKVVEVSPLFTEVFLKYFDVNLYYALFVAALNIGILFFILRRRTKLNDHKEKQEEQRIPKLIFFDSIDDAGNWEDYGSGKVYKSDEISWSGKFSLKKDANPDPYGGFRLLGRKIKAPFIFSGWIYRSDIENGRWADRLALEDENNNGYGFSVSHGNRAIGIERRDGGVGTFLPKSGQPTPPLNKWYHFQFYVGLGGTLSLSLYDQNGVQIIGAISVKDNKYKSFDRIVIHGGYPYYIDDLRIMST